jgi:hypothetical protein
MSLVNEGGDKMISQRDLDSNAKQITVRVNAYEGGIIESFLNHIPHSRIA